MKTLIASLFATGLLITSCGWGRQATGVMVWASDSSKIENGTIVWVLKERRILGTSEIQAENDPQTIEVDSWRILSFEKEDEARDFAASFRPWRYLWARAIHQGTPLHQKPEHKSQIVYKLRQDEKVKILHQFPQEHQKDPPLEFWVKALTQDGYSGWCPNHSLQLIEKKPHQPERILFTKQEDQTLSTLLETVWYPEDFKFMIDQNRINLDLFNTEAGLRLLKDSQTLQLIWPVELLKIHQRTQGDRDLAEESYDFTWESVSKNNDSTYHFVGKEPLSIQLMDVQLRRIVVRFTKKEQTREFVLVRLDQPISSYISQELASRQEKLQELLARGQILTSPTYGTLTLDAEGHFDWQGFDTLMPPYGSYLPAGTPSTGKLVFDWFKDRNLVGDYKVLRMQFDDDNISLSRIFLWRFLKQGVQFLPLRQSDLDDSQHTVLRESQPGISLFFTYQDQ